MLFFVTENTPQTRRLEIYQRTVREELRDRGIAYREISVTEGFDGERLGSKSNRQDIWFFADINNPFFSRTSTLSGEVLVSVHSPNHITERNIQLLKTCSKFFVDSSWSVKRICERYPVLGKKSVISGFPFSRCKLEDLDTVKTEEDLVIFNQHFCADRLHVLQVWLTQKLADENYRIHHLCHKNSLKEIWHDREARVLLREARKRGLQLVICNDDKQYYDHLTRGAILTSTWIHGGLSVGILEAAALGVTPLAPAYGPYLEYLPEQNLYSPYNLDHLMNKIYSPPPSPERLNLTNPATVVDTYIKAMEIS